MFYKFIWRQNTQYKIGFKPGIVIGKEGDRYFVVYCTS